jgi:hypothetical protein
MVGNPPSAMFFGRQPWKVLWTVSFRRSWLNAHNKGLTVFVVGKAGKAHNPTTVRGGWIGAGFTNQMAHEALRVPISKTFHLPDNLPFIGGGVHKIIGLRNIIAF